MVTRGWQWSIMVNELWIWELSVCWLSHVCGEDLTFVLCGSFLKFFYDWSSPIKCVMFDGLKAPHILSLSLVYRSLLCNLFLSHAAVVLFCVANRSWCRDITSRSTRIAWRLWWKRCGALQRAAGCSLTAGLQHDWKAKLSSQFPSYPYKSVSMNNCICDLLYQ